MTDNTAIIHQTIPEVAIPYLYALQYYVACALSEKLSIHVVNSIHASIFNKWLNILKLQWSTAPIFSNYANRFNITDYVTLLYEVIPFFTTDKADVIVLLEIAKMLKPEFATTALHKSILVSIY